MKNKDLNKRLFLFTGFLIAALMGLLMLLIYWGKKSIDLREALFVDQVNIAVDESITEMEQQYYCFDLRSDLALPKLDSFYVVNPPGINNEEENKLLLNYTTSEGKTITFHKMPLMGPAHMQLLLRFEFDNIPEVKADSSLTDFELFVRDSYRNYISDANGIRLIDTVLFDSLLYSSVRRLYPEAELAYSIRQVDNNEGIFSRNFAAYKETDADLKLGIFDNDIKLPDLTLYLEIVNKKDMFAGQAWNIYLSASLLALISLFLIYYMIKMQLEQKKLLRIQKDFVHGMTHEFNTPISNIKLVAQSLIKSKDASVKKSAEILNEEGNKLLAGINLVLTTALIEKNELLLQKEYVDIRSLLESTVEKNRELLKDCGIVVDFDCTDQAMSTKGDAFHLENVFQNMITNVRKHSGADTLNVKTVRSNGDLIIMFSDNGKGISSEDRKKIFEKFESRSSNGNKNGYGLGLYYSRMILEMHGGKIELSDEVANGSSFSIQLPV
jgi:two-component system phosphate regulon sensor histidine kinase PhoR